MNRKQRRAQAATPSTASPTLRTANDIPLSQPDRSGPKSKTLYEIAAEKQVELLAKADRLNNGTATGTTGIPALSPSNSSVVNVTIGPDGEIIHIPADGSDPATILPSSDDTTAIPPLLDTLLLTTSMAFIHFTLETLTVHQYAQDLHWLPILKRTVFVAFPVLFLLIHLCHGHIFPLSSLPIIASSPRMRRVLGVVQSLLYVGVANWSGCYLIQLTNDKGYYAVMKNAPSVGTLWVWSVIELGLAGALAGVVGPGLYAWWSGYGIW